MSEYITDSTGGNLNGFSLKSGQTISIRVYSPLGATSCLLNACRADFVESSPTGETTETAILHGQELIDDDAITARIAPAAFATICGFSNALELGPIAPGGYAEVDISVTISAGRVAFGLAVRAN